MAVNTAGLTPRLRRGAPCGSKPVLRTGGFARWTGSGSRTRKAGSKRVIPAPLRAP